MNLPPLNFDLSLAQEFEILQIKKSLPNLSREEIEHCLIETLRQKFIITNNFRQVINPCTSRQEVN